MRLLVTGIAGFVDYHVMKFLNSTYPDYSILCADTLGYTTTYYVRALELRAGVKVGYVEEAGLTSGFISLDQVAVRVEMLSNTSYGD